MIPSRADLHERLGRLRTRPAVAVDCEFHSEGTYYPELCLVQLAAGDEAFALDPLAHDPAVLGPLLADPAIVKVFHSGEIDVQVLARATGGPIRTVFDTQIAAAFAGHDASPGYALLVERLCGVALSKTSQFTDWRARPLSPEQVTYALNDVRYLLPMADTLKADLVRRGRLAWAQQEIDEMVARALTPRDRSRQYLKLGPFREMSPRQLAILREVAAWRDERAAQLNLPVQRVAADRALRQLAFDPPRSVGEVAELRGLQGLGRGAAGLHEAVEHALALPDDRCPPVFASRVRDLRLEPVAQLLATALRVRANELAIAPSMIANRDDLEVLAGWHFAGRTEPAPELASPTGWRFAAAGDLLQGVLAGRVRVRVDADAPVGVVVE